LTCHNSRVAVCANCALVTRVQSTEHPSIPYKCDGDRIYRFHIVCDTSKTQASVYGERTIMQVSQLTARAAYTDVTVSVSSWSELSSVMTQRATVTPSLNFADNNSALRVQIASVNDHDQDK